MSEEVIGTTAPVHDWFGLSYSNYLVIPRAILESMPVGWQKQFVDLLRECDTAVADAKIETSAKYRVTPIGADGKFAREPMPHYRHAPNVFGRERST